MRTLFLFFTLLLSLNSQSDEAIQLESLTVEATKTELMNSDYQVFQRDAFINRYQNLASFLQQQNGLQIQQAGGLGNPALISIRGASGSQTTLLVNGIATNDSQYGGYDLNSIPLNQIERIEISRSGSSFDLSDQAIGGTINIITREGTSNQNISLNLGSEETIATSFSGSINPNLSLQVDHERSANNYDYPVPSPISDSSQRNQDQPLTNADFSRTSMQLAQSFKEVSARVRLNKQSKNIPDYFRNNPKNNANLSKNSATFSLQGVHRLEHTEVEQSFSSEHNWKVFHHKTDEHYQDSIGVIGLGKDNDKFIQTRSEAQWQSKLLFQQWQFQTQLSGYEENFSSRYIDDDDSYLCTTPQGNCDQQAHQQSTQALAGLRWSNQEQSQQLTTDLYQSHTTSYNRKRSSSTDKEDINKNFTGYNIKYSLFLNKSETHFSIKHSNRQPSLYQLFGDRGLLLGNPDLLDETSLSYSIDHLDRINDKHQMNSAIFYRQLENAIVPVYDSRGVGRYENSKEAYLSGIEWQWRYQGDNFYSHLGTDLYQSQSFDDDVKSFDNKQIAGIYHNSLSLITGWNQQQHNLELVNQINGNLYIDRSNLISGDDYYLIDINYQYQHSQLSLGFSNKNLADTEYKDFTNRPTIGRQWIIFTNYNF
jgi:outer membrane cobalamin receptor